MLNKLFVYGTLLDETGATMSHFLSRNSKLVGDGKMQGELFDLGHYPGAVFDPQASGFVYGKIFELKHPEKVLQQLDYYEGIGLGNKEDCEYLRTIKPVFSNDQVFDCWVYLYQLPTDKLEPIESGNYQLYHPPLGSRKESERNG